MHLSGEFFGSGRIIPTILEKGWRPTGTGPSPSFWPFMVSLAPVGVSFSMLMHYNEAQGLLEVASSTILGLIGSNQFLSYPVFLNGCVIP